MSGSVGLLELELLLGWDNLSHSLQKLLNVNNIGKEPEIKIIEYYSEFGQEQAAAEDTPYMGVQPMYYQGVLHAMTAPEEENRKFLT